MIIKWNENVIRKELVNPNLIHFIDWIDKYGEAGEDMPRTHNSFYARTHQSGKSEQRTNARKICPLCSQSRNLGKCQKYLSENVYDRQQTVRPLNLCPNCLSEHPKGQCNSKYRFQIDNCNAFHHSTIHRNYFNTTQPSNPGQKQSASEYRHNGDNLNRNQFNFTNNSSSWNKNLSSTNPKHNNQDRHNGNSNYNRQRNKYRYNSNNNSNNKNYINKNSINCNSNNSTNGKYNNSNSYNGHNRNFYYGQSHQVPNTSNFSQSSQLPETLTNNISAQQTKICKVHQAAIADT